MQKPRTVPADPSQWAVKSQRSVSFFFKKEYTDIHYKCWSCGTPSVFTAEDQKYTYEVKKVNIDQQRVLCHACWRESNRLQSLLREKEANWAESKHKLRGNADFLSEWLNLLQRLEHYVRYKPDIAKKNMLKKLLQSVQQGKDSPHE